MFGILNDVLGDSQKSSREALPKPPGLACTPALTEDGPDSWISSESLTTPQILKIMLQ